MSSNKLFYSPEGVHFMTAMGAEIAAQKQGDAFSLNLRGSFHEDVQQITAYYEVKNDSTKKTKKVPIGALNVISYDQIEKNMVLVPVNGNNTSIPRAQLETYLNDAYSPANVSWTVSQHAGVQVEYSHDMSQGLDDGESRMLSNYTKEMNKVITALKRSGDYDEHKTYVFLVDKARNPAKAGFMPKKRPWGFVFTDIHKRNNINPTKALCRTIAHEVAHGEFRLSHPFQDFPSIPENSTQNLMDYADGQQLRKYQWDDIHNLRDVELWGQEEEGNASVNKREAYKQIERLRYGRATRKPISLTDYSFMFEEFEYPKGSSDPIVFYGIHATGGEYLMTDKYSVGNTVMRQSQCLKFVFTHSGENCNNPDYLSNIQFTSYPGELTLVVNASQNNKFISDILTLTYSSWISEFKQLIKEMNWERLQYYPEEAYYELSIDDRLEVINGIFNSNTISDGYLWSADKENILASVVKNISGITDQRKLLEVLLKNNAIINLIKDIDGSELKSFVFTISDYITKVYGKSSYAELARYNLSQSGAYNKIFRWAETAGPDPSYHSKGSRRLGYFIITYNTDWWFDEEEKLMDISPYEFVGIQIESPIESLNANTGDFVVIPGVLFHWILKQQDRKQAFDDAVLAADLSLTVFTLGTYAGVKTAVKVGTKVTIAMTIDFVFQAAIISLDPEFNFTDVKLTDVVWSGASSLIKDPKMNIVISSIRGALKGAYEESDKGFEEASLVALEIMENEIIIAIITHGLVGQTNYLNLLEKTFKKSPKAVYDKLISLGIKPKDIQSVSNQFVSNALKLTIKSLGNEKQKK
ncbi:hypothetical protein BZG01_12515 [Labilibaculum manganireducens]|uniref:Uncharacterized protein n=1 Tax=Labilibaculum manganireducens TaxID=1940525 RepID=A0A2N3I6Q6_9BACT|nr:hypothetical protein [Labilibaculum manganireducens]PKQ65981.1 hypothetical protein BZG01_12515 [Labilibaculum manganireducens]